MEKISERQVLIFSSICIHYFLTLSIAQQEFLRSHCSNDAGNYTNGSPYQRNLNTTLSSFFSSPSSNNMQNYGFYNNSFGQEPNRVNAFSLCKGDLLPDVCRSCVQNATREIVRICPNQKEAVGWYDLCMIRISNRSILGVMETEPWYHIRNGEVVQGNVNEFERGLQDLLNIIRSRAASGDWRRKYATENTTANFLRIYALAQCTPDLTEQECTDCLDDAYGKIPQLANGTVGMRIVSPSCNIRFETYLFYRPVPELPPLVSILAPPPVSTLPPEGNGGNTARTVISIVVPIVIVVLTITVCGLCIFLRRRKRYEKTETADEIERVESLQFDFNTVRTATNNFSNDNKLGQGGFGAVYKGRLPNGQDVAVKRLSSGSVQGDAEFKNEVLLVAKLQHRNLVRLLGFCLERNERLLIYEFVPNTSLDHFIFDPVKQAQLNWERRYKIIGGIARGILYLHEDSRLRIIHRDLKASNILLDGEMNPKIADFGMAKLFEMDETQGNTSKIVGTYGYMAPEYMMRGQFSVKSDVFSFGVLVLEIVTGQKNNCFHNGENVEELIRCVWRNWREGTALNTVDPTLSNCSRHEVMRCIHIGLLCVQENIAHRPTMASVVLMLSSFSLTLPVPSEPTFFVRSAISNHSSSTVGNNSRTTESGLLRSEVLPSSVNEASITELDPR